MKKLLLIRHAKAEKDAENDFERPLKYTGMQDAAFMAERLKERSIVPEHIISSPAMRAKTTAEIFADHFLMPEPELEQQLYEASLKTWMKVIGQLPAKYHFVALVGHNPGVSQVVYELAGDTREIHTAAAVLVEVETDDWSTISGGDGKIAYFSWPNE